MVKRRDPNNERFHLYLYILDHVLIHFCRSLWAVYTYTLLREPRQDYDAELDPAQ